MLMLKEFVYAIQATLMRIRIQVMIYRELHAATSEQLVMDSQTPNASVDHLATSCSLLILLNHAKLLDQIITMA